MMIETGTEGAIRPDNVPIEHVVDYNLFAPPSDRDIQSDISKLLHAGPDIVWTPQNGGHWIFTRADDIDWAQRDSDLFSMREISLPPGTTPTRNIPLEAEEPEHTHYRAILQPSFAPAAIMAMEDGVRDLAVRLINGFRTAGACEFVQDFGAQLPIVIFMKMADLPTRDRAMLVKWANDVVRPAKPQDRIDAYVNTNRYIIGMMEERRGGDRDDLVSRVMRARMPDRALTEEEQQSMIQNAMFGGLDTVTSGMSFVAWFLARSPTHRTQLVERPALIPRAVEELLRRHGVTSTARVITRDFEHKGLRFREGDRVLVQTMLHGFDERRFSYPDIVDFERPNSRHAVFGNGTHRCIGALLARIELKVFLQEWLPRIPDFSLDPDDPPRAEAGLVNSVSYMPLKWDPATTRP